MRGREPIERKNSLDWEKKLQERQVRLIEGQRSLNQREEYLNMAMKHIEKEMQDDKKKIEKDHETLKEKEARHQRMVALVSRKNDATEEKSPINKEEEKSACLITVEMKKSYIGALKNTFTSRKTKREDNYVELNTSLHTREIKRMG